MTVKGKGGRPKFEPTPEILEKIETYAAMGMRKNSIAFALDLNPSTFSEKQAEYPELGKAFERGRSKGVAHAASKLHELIKDKHYPAIQFYLKSQDGWEEGDKTNIQIQPITLTVDGKKITMGID